MEPDTSTTAIVTTQPDGLADPSLTEVTPERPTTIPTRPSKRHRFKYILRGLSSVILDFLHLLFIGFVYVIPGAIALAVLVVLTVGFSMAWVAAYGAMLMLTGNAILRINLAYYTNDATAASIGAVGSLTASVCMSILSLILPRDGNGNTPWFITIPLTVVYSTLTGVIGSAILHHNQVDLHGTDVLHATRAGAVGGAVFGPGAALAIPLIMMVIAFVLSPLLLAMQMGLRWVYVHASEGWDGRTYRSSYCYTYGTCGDDPEIEEELAQIPRNRLQNF